MRQRLLVTQEESWKEKLAGMFSSWNKHITLISASIFTSVKWNWSIAEKLWSNKATWDQYIAGRRLISSGQPYRNNRPDYCGLQVTCQCKISEFDQSGKIGHTLQVTHNLIGQIQNHWGSLLKVTCKPQYHSESWSLTHVGNDITKLNLLRCQDVYNCILTAEL